ncbi:heavy metal translocating P-type ATPase [Peptoniphilus sp. oral taxon 386]|uniref:heavy metal translocating P-type ATPase n=1 Tax=Peptoniphilus sp. oral taxon 386 TaxID=652713 RepID=UPI0001DA9D27|nr:heavy metal translocating P-type ATPase [Peptoniphilus sp. oral taxon 386]EFI41301.1 cadmium-exporting ATPase [Peptoniphilus sp. oral taxon 386 str. F0131]
MKYKLKNLDCEVCSDDIRNHSHQIEGIDRVYNDNGEIVIESHEDISASEILNNISTHLKHIGHEHNMTICSEYIIYLRGLNCAHCTKKIEEATSVLGGVKSANYDFTNEKFNLLIEDSADRDSIFNEVKVIVDRIEPEVVVEKADLKKSNTELKKISIFDYKMEFLKFAAILAALILTVILKIPDVFKLVVYLLLYLYLGQEVIVSAAKNVIKGEVFDERFLMSVASIGAFVVGEYPEAVAVMLFYKVGQLFENIALENSRNSISKVLELKAEYANVLIGDIIKEVDPKDVNIGDIIFIRPGEKVPLDGVVIDGNSNLDTSNITGESIPRFVDSGDEVISGCINIDRPLKVEVQKNYENTTVAKILELVENSAVRKSKTEKIITKFAKVYTPIVVLLAVLITVILPLRGILSFYDAFFRACIFLVISCPCAFVISVPLGVFAGIGSASKNGIFVKGGNYLEALSDVSNIVFDKTGTITKGIFEISDIKPVGEFSDKEILKYAVTAERTSTHPIATAILKRDNSYFEDAEDFNEYLGKGIVYTLNGDKIFVGNGKLLKENNIEFETLHESGVVVYVAKAGSCIGSIVISDSVKDEAWKEIRKLKKLGMHLTILSGDNEENTKLTSNSIGINDCYGDLLPNEKVEKLEEIMKKATNKVLFVGDGVNDAPVLSRADIGVAMGTIGSDSAIDAADIVIMNDELSKIATAIKISNKTKKIIYQNIFFALFVKILVLILGALGLTTMWVAVFADVGVTVIAVLNSIRALN